MSSDEIDRRRWQREEKMKQRRDERRRAAALAVSLGTEENDMATEPTDDVTELDQREVMIEAIALEARLPNGGSIEIKATLLSVDDVRQLLEML